MGYRKGQRVFDREYSPLHWLACDGCDRFARSYRVSVYYVGSYSVCDERFMMQVLCDGVELRQLREWGDDRRGLARRGMELVSRLQSEDLAGCAAVVA